VNLCSGRFRGFSVGKRGLTSLFPRFFVDVFQSTGLDELARFPFSPPERLRDPPLSLTLSLLSRQLRYYVPPPKSVSLEVLCSYPFPYYGGPAVSGGVFFLDRRVSLVGRAGMLCALSRLWRCPRRLHDCDRSRMCLWVCRRL